MKIRALRIKSSEIYIAGRLENVVVYREHRALFNYNKEWSQDTTRIQSGHIVWNNSLGQCHLALAFTISIHLTQYLFKRKDDLSLAYVLSGWCLDDILECVAGV